MIQLNDLRTGSNAAFNYLYSTYYPRLIALASRLTAYRHGFSGDFPEDIASNAILSVYDKRDKFDSVKGAVNFMFSLVKYNSLNTNRNEKRRNEIYGNMNLSDAYEATAESVISRKETINEIRQWISFLPDWNRQFVYMTYINGLTDKEISDGLSLPILQVQTSRSQGVKTLKESMQVIEEKAKLHDIKLMLATGLTIKLISQTTNTSTRAIQFLSQVFKFTAVDYSTEEGTERYNMIFDSLTKIQKEICCFFIKGYSSIDVSKAVGMTPGNTIIYRNRVIERMEKCIIFDELNPIAPRADASVGDLNTLYGRIDEKKNKKQTICTYLKSTG